MVGVGEDQTSRQATGWSLPALLYHSFPPLRLCLPASTFSFFLLLRPPSSSFLLPSRRVSCSVSPPSLASILFIFPRSCSLGYVVRRSSTRSFFSVCARARRGARVTPGTCNLRGVHQRRYAKRPTTLCREAERERERGAVLLLNFYTVCCAAVEIRECREKDTQPGQWREPFDYRESLAETLNRAIGHLCNLPGPA